MKRYQVIRAADGQNAMNCTAGQLGPGVLVVDTFKDNKVVFLVDGQHKKATEKGEVE